MNDLKQDREPLQLSLKGLSNFCELEESLTLIRTHKLYHKVITTNAFKRLNGVSFLGAIDYLPCFKSLPKPQRTRSDHSLNVAALAQMIAIKRSYSSELTHHLVIAGLLHDIGHPPLSHSVEPYLKEKFGFGHHEMGEMILDGQVSLGKDLNHLLNKNIDIAFIKSLIDGKASKVDGGDLFSSKINLDTIDGIIRSYSYLNPRSQAFSTASVAIASFISDDANKFEVLDDFWNLKHNIYDYLITSGDGLLADVLSQNSIREGKSTLTTYDLFKRENSWHQKFSHVFSSIYSLSNKSKNTLLSPEKPLSYTKRKYYIDSKESEINKRYLYTKNKQYLQ
ncbi:HD domain-containing protein [Marinospirillum insulare]|uniref:HD/PDEase domain-containing protein n=1 Tax=Marinospirillum insulare TaxID=217169 RepID=A0ABQ5ZZH7_9GAMM|nr:HD domain-containing protein [Marinospirillum insulare]GLR64407.1 hypothetical protein GCM10007878_18450 [Marinospirillum insulare]